MKKLGKDIKKNNAGIIVFTTTSTILKSYLVVCLDLDGNISHTEKIVVRYLDTKIISNKGAPFSYVFSYAKELVNRKGGVLDR